MHIDEGLDILLKHNFNQNNTTPVVLSFSIVSTFGVSLRPANTPLGRSLTSLSLAVMSGPTAATLQQHHSNSNSSMATQQQLHTSHHRSGDTLPAAPFVQLSTRTVLAPTVTALSRPNWIIGFTLLLTNVNNLININSFPFPPQPLNSSFQKLFSVASKIRSPSY